MKSAKFGVIGVGGWGERHVMAYHQHPAAELVAVCDTNGERVNAVAEKYDVPQRFTDYKEMLAHGGMDAVSIVTPDFAHTDMALEAIRRSKHVLIEKPLATTLEACEKIGEALQGAGVKFMVDFHNRWNPGVVKMKKRIDRGELGEPRMIFYRLSDNISVPTEMLSWAGRSTVNWFLGSHCLDTMRWLLSDEVERVYTVHRSGLLTSKGIDTPDFYQSIIEFSKGATAQLETCWIIARSSPRLFELKIEVFGNKGTAYFVGSPEQLHVFSEEGVEHPDTTVCPQVWDRVVGFGIESISYFADCIINDTEPMVGFEEGYEATKIILAMEESARTGQPVGLR